MALAMPESAQAAPADLVTLTKLAAPDVATTAPVAAPKAPMVAVMQVAVNSLVDAGQLVAATLQEVTSASAQGRSGEACGRRAREAGGQPPDE